MSLHKKLDTPTEKINKDRDLLKHLNCSQSKPDLPWLQDFSPWSRF